MAPLELKRRIVKPIYRCVISRVVAEHEGGWISLNDPNNSRNACAVFVEPHRRKPGHKVSKPYRRPFSGRASTIRHIGKWTENNPVTLRGMRGSGLKVTARWIPSGNMKKNR